MNERVHIDLFSGLGGFALAARWNKVGTIAFCENEPYCQAVLAKNFGAILADATGERKGKPADKAPPVSISGETRIKPGGGSPPIHPDIRTFDGKAYAGAWLVTGGFPCQPASCAGQHRGAADHRWLWPECLRVTCEIHPHWCLFENVPGLLSLKSGLEFEDLCFALEREGYAVQPLLIPAAGVGAPHRRERVWIVAYAEHNAGWANQPGRQAEGRTAPGCASEDVSDPSVGTRQRPAPGPTGHAAQLHQVVPHTGRELPQGRQAESTPGATEWMPQSGVGGMVVRLPSWLDEPTDLPRVTQPHKGRAARLRGLGNSIVPQIAAEIIRCMIEAETTQ